MIVAPSGGRRLLASPPVALALALGAGLAIGAAVTFGWALAVLGALLGGALALLLLSSTRSGLLAVIAIATLLPFGVIPVRLGVQLTLLDAALATLLLVWLLGASQHREPLQLTAPGAWLGAFLVVAVAAFALGARQIAFDELTRRFVKLLASLVLYYCVVNTIRAPRAARLLERALIAGATLAALLAVGIWALPTTLQVRLLSALGPLGYPTGEAVLRYLPGPNNTYSDTLRAVGTSIDPNVLGGMLMLAAALAAGHLFGKAPLAPRWALAGALVALAAGMALSNSRSSWVGFAAALGFLALFRSRRVLVAGAVVGALLLLSPVGQTMLDRLASGFATQDKASELRLQEYRNAVAIIRRYPLLGIGFGPAPDLDLQEGVSSLYLTLAEQTGLVGTALYLAAVGTALLGSLRSSPGTSPDVVTSLGATQAALVAALTAGLFDHYFVNKDFPHMVALFWLIVGLLVAWAHLAAAPRAAAATVEERAGARG